MDAESIDISFGDADPLPFSPQSRRDDSSLEESQALHAVLTDSTGQLWAAWRHLPAELFSNFKARRAWEALSALPAFSASGIANCRDALGFYAPHLALSFPAAEAPRIFARLLWAWAEREGPRVQSEAGRLLAQGAASGGKPFQLWTSDQFLAWEPKPDADVWGRYIAAGELTSFVGAGGLGKSRLVLHLALSQILRRPWLGFTLAERPRRWLLMNLEASLTRWKSDLGKMLARCTDRERQLVRDNLRGLAIDGDELGVLNFGELASAERFEKTLRAWVPDVVVIDPWAHVVAGDENSAEAVGETLSVLTSIQRRVCPHAAIVIVAHARTGAANVLQAGDRFSAGNFGRGSKALFSRVRCEIQLAPGDKTDPNRLVLSCGKSNDAAHFPTIGVVFDEDIFDYRRDDDFDEEAWRLDVQGKRKDASLSVEDVVLAVRELAPRPGEEASTKAIFDHLREITGASLRSVKRRVSDAITANYLTTQKRGFYRLGAKPLKQQ